MEERKPWTPEQDARPLVDIETEFCYHLADQDALEYFIREGVSLDILYTPRTKNVYQFAQHHYHTTNKAPNLVTLAHEFQQIDWQAPQTEYQWVVEKLRQRYQRNEVEALTTTLAEKVANPDEAMGYLRDRFIEIEKNSMTQRSLFKPGDHELFISELQEKIWQGQYRGASVGFSEIDDFTGGIKPGQIGYLLARPKRQKTFQMLNAFIKQAEEGRKPILYTLELTREEIELRLSCILSGVSWDRAQKGQLVKSDYKDFREAWEQFNADGKQYWFEMPPLDERSVPALTLKADKLGAESILISQFKYIRGTKDYYRNSFDEPAEVAVALKQAAIKPGSERPFYVEAQFNRGGDSMDELADADLGKVGLTDMIGQSADILFGLFQSRELRANNQLEFGIIDSRNTDKAAWYLKYDLKQQTEFEFVSGSEHY